MAIPLDAHILAICGGLSICALLATRPPRGGQIQLVADDPLENLDLFDVGRMEEMIDGYPVNELEFWKAMRLRKIIMAAVIFGVLICEFLSFRILIDTSIASLFLRIAFSAYIFLLLLSSILQDSLAWHSRSISHLSVLTLAASCILGVSSMSLESGSQRLPNIIGVLFFLASAIALTTPSGPPLHYPKPINSTVCEENVAGNANGSIASTWLFLFTTKVLALGTRPSFEISDLPILKASMRATKNYTEIRRSTRSAFFHIGSWRPLVGSGLQLGYNILRVNIPIILAVHLLSFVIAFTYYAPPFFLQKLLEYLEADTARSDTSWGWIWVAGLFLAHFLLALVMAQVTFVTAALATRMRMQLNTLLFAKTFARKDVASSSSDDTDATGEEESGDSMGYSKAGIIALMSSDVDQVSGLADGIYDITDTPFEILVGVFFLYRLLGVSCFVGLAVTLVFLPLHQRSGTVVARTQRNLVKARDERVALTNEILGAIRMLKFMAWERNFEARVMQIRDKELAYQKLSYIVGTLWTAMGNSVPIMFALVSFWHFTVVREQVLTPAIAFTALSIFTELQFSIKGIPASIINLIQGHVSLRRIDRYLNGAEVYGNPENHAFLASVGRMPVDAK